MARRRATRGICRASAYWPIRIIRSKPPHSRRRISRNVQQTSKTGGRKEPSQRRSLALATHFETHRQKSAWRRGEDGVASRSHKEYTGLCLFDTQEARVSHAFCGGSKRHREAFQPRGASSNDAQRTY